MIKAKEYRDMDLKSLQGKHDDLQAEFFNLKFQQTLAKLENTTLIRQKRREIARVKTVIAEKSSGGKVADERK